MVRIKQIFPTDSPCSSSSLQDLNGLQAPEKSGQTGCTLPHKKAVKPVQSSGEQKRSETNRMKLDNFKDIVVNLDEIDESYYTRCTESMSNTARRKANQREVMDVSEKEKERELNKNRIGLKRVRMNDREVEEERELNKIRIGLKRARMTENEIENARELNRLNMEESRKLKKRAYDSFYCAAGDHCKAKFYELGPFDVICSKCNSLHFPEEISEQTKNNSFFSCCKDGNLLKIEENIEEYPEELKVLFDSNHPYHKNFITNIRRYNSSFACASLSCFKFKFPTPGPPCYKIQGQVYHIFNPNALPVNENEIPTNGQLYFLDSEEAIDVRCEMNKECDPNIMNYIDKYIRENNKFAESYQLMSDVYEKQQEICRNTGTKMPEIRLLFSLKEHYDQRRYNMPYSNEVCAIMVGDANEDIPPANIIVYPKGEKKLKTFIL